MVTGEGCQKTCSELGTLIMKKKEASDVQKSLTIHQLSEASDCSDSFHKTTAVIEQFAYRMPSHNNSSL
jgi:hypothetical protein